MIPFVKRPLLLLPFLALSGCGDAVPRPQDFGVIELTACRAGMAQIALYDSGFQNLCGCAEAGTATGAPSVTCTVPVGTVVFFHYSAAKLTHQIVSTGAASFVSSPVVDPLLPLTPRTHAVTFGAAGTYPFADAYNANYSGQIIVI
jgi:hypothetical protein